MLITCVFPNDTREEIVRKRLHFRLRLVAIESIQRPAAHEKPRQARYKEQGNRRINHRENNGNKLSKERNPFQTPVFDNRFGHSGHSTHVNDHAAAHADPQIIENHDRESDGRIGEKARYVVNVVMEDVDEHLRNPFVDEVLEHDYHRHRRNQAGDKQYRSEKFCRKNLFVEQIGHRQVNRHPQEGIEEIINHPFLNRPQQKRIAGEDTKHFLEIVQAAKIIAGAITNT